MQFRDLQKQYQTLKPQIDAAIQAVLSDANFISGPQVTDLERHLAEYVGAKHCITCGNGTDALTLALMAWNIGPGDAVFVPDFTFFASGETPAYQGAVPVFVDVEEDTFNMSPASLKAAIEAVLKEDVLRPRAIIAVDLFGQPADYPRSGRLPIPMACLFWRTAPRDLAGVLGSRGPAALEIFPQPLSFRQSHLAAMGTAGPYLQIMTNGRS